MKNSPTLMVVLISLLFVAACADRDPSMVAPVQQMTTSETSTSRFVKMEVKDKDAVCVEMINNAILKGEDSHNDLRLLVSDVSNCEDSMTVKIPGVEVNAVARMIVPASSFYPSSWMSPVLFYGSCSLEIKLDNSQLFFQFDICSNKLLDSERAFPKTPRYSLDSMNKITVNPVILTNADRVHQKVSRLSMRNFEMMVSESVSNQIKITEEFEIALWNKAVTEAILESGNNEK